MKLYLKRVIVIQRDAFIVVLLFLIASASSLQQCNYPIATSQGEVKIFDEPKPFADAKIICEEAGAT